MNVGVTAVPVNEPVVVTPVTTVVFAPFVGNEPALKVSFSFVESYVREGKEPTAVIEFTVVVVVAGVTVTLPAGVIFEIVPAGL